MVPSELYPYPCDNSSSCYPYNIKLHPGKYFIELWGAQGGGSYYNSIYTPGIGKGGYSCGVLILRKTQRFYLYVGGKGTDGTINVNKDAPGGYNGGGLAYSDYCYGAGDHDDPPGSGGGASDIRTKQDELETRIAVAGGAGGNGAYAYSKGLSGLSYSYGGGSISGPGSSTKSATLSEGYQKGTGEIGMCYPRSGGSGGGGYFGGYGGKCSGDDCDNGSGGSGYIGGLSSYGKWERKTIPGNTEFPSPISGREVGHSGNGAIKISYISSSFCTNHRNINQPNVPNFSAYILLAIHS